ncbi:hypothetical protein BHU72_11945 [Desulfuribacillus stibiiarsenatis]|uniref:RNA polymerase sigma-70 region 4 domain-containing protein n=1 Tax=Desulfuribacillus stibiiarsenatis TaxID=1390249 RepID=A0A1E5L7X6_9FIRM|nr:hypothetical protein [Desulfuribacillus stibiiarsenatis]OEH86241.1 hypothetical protein BHU72_11945 [Desulfuribacillus stibiiarsenatis]
MNILSTYNDTLTEIQMIDLRIKSLEMEHEILWKEVNRKPTSIMERALNRMAAICNEVESLALIQKEKQKALDEMDKKIDEFQSIYYKVAYMRDVKGLSLVSIGLELGYSYEYIRKISMKVPRTRRVKALL